MDVRTLLDLLGTKPLGMVSPEAKQLADLLRKEANITLHIGDHTGDSLITLIGALNENLQLKIMNFHLNDGVDAIEYQKSVQEILELRSREGRRLQTLMSFSCGTLLALIIITLCWCLYTGKPLPPWETLLIILATPGAIVLKTNGVLSDENKELIRGTLGSLPPIGPVGMLVGAFTKNRRSSDRGGFDQRSRSSDRQPYGAAAMSPYPQPPHYTNDPSQQQTGASNMAPNLDPPRY
jgi:hypothetical protein